MGDMTMDWKNEASGDFPVYKVDKPTTFKVEIQSWEEKASKNQGTPQILWNATIRDASNAEWIGGKISCFTPLTPKALWRVANLVQGCGIDLSNCGKMQVGSDAFRSVLDSCVHRTTYWLISYDPTYKNNKVEEFIKDEEQEIIEPKETRDPACPF